MPISAVGGRWEHMAVLEDVFFSGTHGGETLSLAAARAVLDTVADGTVLADIEALGRIMVDGVAERIERNDVGHRVTVGGEPHRAVVGTCGTDALVDKTWVQQCLLEAGCLFNGSMFISAAHTEADVATALDAFDTAFARLTGDDPVDDLLVGPPLAPVFRAP
jgi:glutamate-1-semialdehyde aminotransferase